MTKPVTIASEFITLSEAARQLGISRQSIYDWIAKGRLTPYRVGGHPMLLEADIDRLQKTRSEG